MNLYRCHGLVDSISDDGGRTIGMHALRGPGGLTRGSLCRRRSGTTDRAIWSSWYSDLT